MVSLRAPGQRGGLRERKKLAIRRALGAAAFRLANDLDDLLAALPGSPARIARWGTHQSRQPLPHMFFACQCEDCGISGVDSGLRVICVHHGAQ